jgi:hypothetical protein
MILSSSTFSPQLEVPCSWSSLLITPIVSQRCELMPMSISTSRSAPGPRNTPLDTSLPADIPSAMRYFSLWYLADQPPRCLQTAPTHRESGLGVAKSFQSAQRSTIYRKTLSISVDADTFSHSSQLRVLMQRPCLVLRRPPGPSIAALYTPVSVVF